jgi:hypothetical protein
MICVTSGKSPQQGRLIEPPIRPQPWAQKLTNNQEISFNNSVVATALPCERSLGVGGVGVVRQFVPLGACRDDLVASRRVVLLIYHA